MRTSLGILLLLTAYFLLLPGLTRPMLSVSGTVEKRDLVELGQQMIRENANTPTLVTNLVDMVVEGLDVSGSINAFDKTRSILGTARALQLNGHWPVALMIVVFSIGVPLLKALLLLSLLLPLPMAPRRALLAISDAISKWSMADVFVIAIFIAFLAGKGLQASRSLVEFDASLGIGFWYFSGYCLLSILGTQLLSAGLRQRFQAPAPEATADVH